MSIIIKLQGLPLEANSVDVRLYFLGLTIPDGGVHIVGGDQGTVFIEFASDEDARQAMARGVGTIKNSNIKLLLSSRSEMQSVIDSVHLKHQQFLQQQQHQQQQHLHQPQQQFQPPPMMVPQVQPWFGLPQQQPQQQQPQPPPPLLPWMQQSPQSAQQTPLLPQYQIQPNTTTTSTTTTTTSALLQQQQQQHQHQQLLEDQQFSVRDRARMSGMRGGDDKLFADKRCVLAASNIPYRATSKDIIEFLSDFNINEDNIRRRYNQKGQATADAKIAFPTPDAAMKAMKMMNKKTICGRPVFLKPV